MKLKSSKRLLLGAAALTSLLVAHSASALPFNQDMVTGETRPAGSVMRPRAPGTMPVGSLDLTVRSPQAAEALPNPNPGDEASVLRGTRLFRVNCAPCHG